MTRWFCRLHLARLFSWRMASLACLVAVSATPVVAQKPAKPFDPLVGSWAFETRAINLNCKLSGDMNVWKERSGAYACSFTAIQSCTGANPIEIKVAQTCTATESNRKVAILSRIDRVVSAKPKDLLPLVKERYEPDHFNVTLNAAGSEMTGMFHSIGEASVRFWRHEALTS